MVDEEFIGRVKEFHGHICPFMVLSSRAAEVILSRLGVRRGSVVEALAESTVCVLDCVPSG
jgi:formylmethanofuran dehydrogenase subunit E